MKICRSDEGVREINDKWDIYEKRKIELQRLDPDEYAKAIKKLAEELGL